MLRLFTFFFAVVLLVQPQLLFAQNSSQPDGFTTLNIGDAAPDFDLPGVDNRNHKLADYADTKVLMVVFTCNHCPTAQAYEERLNQMVDDYSDCSVSIVAISPNDPKAVRPDELGYTDVGDTLQDMKVRAKKAGFKFPYLFDGEAQKVSLSYGVLATPHVFIFDAERKLRYTGRIDDSVKGRPKSRDAKNAIDAILDDKNVKVETTSPNGCSIKWYTQRAEVEAYLKKCTEDPVELKEIDLEDLNGIARNETENLRAVVLWAPWGQPDLDQLQDLVEINRIYRNRRFEIVTVSCEFDARHAKLVLEKNKAAFRNLFVKNIDGFSSAKVLGKFPPAKPDIIPQTLLITSDGRVVYHSVGKIKPSEFRSKIVELLGRSPADDSQPITDPSLRKTLTIGENFKTDNLVPWCTVAFDSRQRSPEDRAKMIVDLGLKRNAYAWRKKHLPEFEREIEAYKANGIEYFAFFNWHQSMEPLIKKHGIKPQIWHYLEANPPGTQEEKIIATADSVKSIVDKTRELGLKFAFYNHRKWTGEPDNMIAVVEYIRKTWPDSDHVGIVYNFHHGHRDIDDFEGRFNRMLPYLFCVNLNGMIEAENINEKTLEKKILTIGTGKYEKEMIRTVIESGYSGPIGIIDHRNEVDSEVAIRDNIEGLQTLLTELSGENE